ncbi:alpha/beta hydrolase [Candidatus Pacearchaeota archaeon]|nr:alpha/beta hydrolase [Candidatus Pacearchaeota archaeon]
MKMKKIYLIHGWGGSSEGGWFDWLKSELEKKGFKVKAFDMPDTENPKIENWVGFLKENISPEEIDEETYFIGHSIGCQTIMRFLEKLHKHKRIGGCVFVAGWFKLMNLGSEELKIAHPWENTLIDFERVLDHCDNFLAIFSDNDPYVHLDEAEKFKDFLGAKIIIKKKQGHFTDEDNVGKIPEILKFL